jgi:hypothetical protein
MLKITALNTFNQGVIMTLAPEQLLSGTSSNLILDRINGLLSFIEMKLSYLRIACVGVQ